MRCWKVAILFRGIQAFIWSKVRLSGTTPSGATPSIPAEAGALADPPRSRADVVHTRRTRGRAGRQCPRREPARRPRLTLATWGIRVGAGHRPGSGVVSTRAGRMVIALMTLSVVAGSWSAAAGNDELRDQQDSAGRRVDQAERRVGESSRALSTATRRLDGALASLKAANLELADANSRVDSARARDMTLRQDLVKAESRLGLARAELSTAVSQVDDQQQRVVDTVVGLYQGGDPGLLAFSSFLYSASTEDLVRRQDAGEMMLAKQARTYDNFRATQVLADVGADHVKDVALEVAARQSAAAANLQELQRARSDSRSAAQDVRQSVQQWRSAQRKARRIRMRDLKLLRRAEAEEARIRERIRDAARRQAARAAASRSRASSTPSATADGFLMRPVAGVVTSPYGYRVHPIYKYRGLHDGIDYGAGCGQPLWAGAPGVVTSRYYSDVFGYRLFVNVGVVDGKGVTLAYNHAAGYSVNVGDRVARGQVIGSVGDTGWSTGCHLHCTVLANGAAVNPENWY